MNIDFYFFNWTNPEELRVPGKKPNFVQMGPYSFVYVFILLIYLILGKSGPNDIILYKKKKKI